MRVAHTGNDIGLIDQGQDRACGLAGPDRPREDGFRMQPVIDLLKIGHEQRPRPLLIQERWRLDEFSNRNRLANPFRLIQHTLFGLPDFSLAAQLLSRHPLRSDGFEEQLIGYLSDFFIAQFCTCVHERFTNGLIHVQ